MMFSTRPKTTVISCAAITFIVFIFSCYYLLYLPRGAYLVRAPKLKPLPPSRPHVVDNFPWAAHALSPSDIPPIPSWNVPPTSSTWHPPTPLLIGFTRNWLMLQQTVVSYLTAGWPASSIYVVENTGTQNANSLGQLTLQNPFYLNHTRLTTLFNVTVVTTPTLLSFAQLQNFYLSLALTHSWPHYFWSHMDVIALSDEIPPPDQLAPGIAYQSIYTRCLAALAAIASVPEPWAIRFFAYDRLALVHTKAFMAIGGWDARIGYYLTDCDMHERLWMAGYTLLDTSAGLVYDIGSLLPDLGVLYRRTAPTVGGEGAVEDGKRWGDEQERGGESWGELTRACEGMQTWKNTDEGGRNQWQTVQGGGRGEPFFVEPDGFQWALEEAIESGKKVYREKWGMDGCGLRERGLGIGDAWRVVG